VSLDLAEERITGVEVTDVRGGETLDRHEVKPGQVVLADRGYAHREAVAGVLEAGGHVVVRLSRNGFPLENRRGKALDLPGCMEGLQIGEMGDWDVQFEAGGRKYEGRLVALRQSEPAAEHERKRIRRVASHKGRKLEARSLKAAGFLYVFTDLPREVLPTAEALEMYRLRWQIEIVFKRLKSVLDLDGLRAKNPDLARAYLYAKILGALVAQEFCHDTLAFFPWGYALFAEQRQSMAVAADLGGGGEDSDWWNGTSGNPGHGDADAAASPV
jgi:IS4 transposase